MGVVRGRARGRARERGHGHGAGGVGNVTPLAENNHRLIGRRCCGSAQGSAHRAACHFIFVLARVGEMIQPE